MLPSTLQQNVCLPPILSMSIVLHIFSILTPSTRDILHSLYERYSPLVTTLYEESSYNVNAIVTKSLHDKIIHCAADKVVFYIFFFIEVLHKKLIIIYRSKLYEKVHIDIYTYHQAV